MNEKIIPLSYFNDLPEHTRGQDVLRYISMPALLGEEKDTIMYFIGRDLARRIEIKKLDDIIFLFKKFNWGALELIKERKWELEFHVMSDDVAQRMTSNFDIEYRLEAGFLAEAITKVMNRPCECIETINERLYRVELKVTFVDG